MQKYRISKYMKEHFNFLHWRHKQSKLLKCFKKIGNKITLMKQSSNYF